MRDRGTYDRAVENVPPDVYEPPLSRWDHIWRVAAMAVISLIVCITPLPAAWRQAHWLAVVDLLLGATAFVLVFFRRRHPMAVATVITVFGVISSTASGPGVLAAVSLATRRVWWQLVVIGGLNVAISFVYAAAGAHSRQRTVVGQPPRRRGDHRRDPRLGRLHRLAPRAALDPEEPRRARRGRAGAADDPGAGQRAGPDRPRDARRARPPHLAGVDARQRAGLPRRTSTPTRCAPAPPSSRTRPTRRSPTCAACSACCATPSPASALEPPQPTYADLAELVDEARSSGLTVRLRRPARQRRRAGCPTSIGRTVYRIVQEGMTNAAQARPGRHPPDRASAAHPSEGVARGAAQPARLRPPARPRAPGSGWSA